MAKGAQTKPAREAPAKDAEERLLVEAAQKDPARFADLYDLHFDRVYAFIARRAGNGADAEDLTSEVFHRALANLPRFEWRGAPFAAWLLRIAANAMADRWKRNARESASELDDPVNLSEPDFVEADRRARVARLVDRLPADQRRVIQMRFAEEKSIREIARALRRSEGAVKQLQFRGVQSLRDLLGEKNG
jgi:RNA polymerase sigma-70 factor (ECF subfamily)